MQDQARSETTRLISIFCLVFLITVLATMFTIRLSVATIALENASFKTLLQIFTHRFPHWIDFAAMTISACIIGVGSLIKWKQLQAGGQVIAHMLGGRLLSREGADLEQARLLNVVEEMSIASGIPVPPVYLLEREGSINAFAAGMNPSDAILGFSQGSVYKLSRDELRGVVAHEFSHIFNGDMRLNMRLLVLVGGLECLTSVGHYLFETDLRGRRVEPGRKNANPLAVIGIGMMIIGGLGSFMAGFIRAAVSRQREYLADATAAQYTRNPEGIGQALLKALIEGSAIKNFFAKEVGHFFLVDSSKKLSSSSHPPLEDRIKRLSPGLLSRRKEFEAGFRNEIVLAERTEVAPTRDVNSLKTIGAAALAGLNEDEIFDRQRTPQTEANTFLAKAKVVAALSVEKFQPDDPRSKSDVTSQSPKIEVADSIVHTLKSFTNNERFLASCYSEIVAINQLPYSEALERRSKDLLVYAPILRVLPKEKRIRFFAMAKAIVKVNNHISTFEGSALSVLRKVLAIRPPNTSNIELGEAASLLLSAVAQQSGNPAHADKALQAGRRQLFSGGLSLPSGFQISLIAFDKIHGERLDEAFLKLDAQSINFRRRFLQALECAAMFDRKMTLGEAEMIRSIGLAFDLPTPDIHEFQEDPASN